MSSITIPVKANDHPNLRPLNVLRDLSAVADLIDRRNQGDCDFHLWPHEGMVPAKDKHVLAEVYPSICPEPTDFGPCEPDDPHQADAWKTLQRLISANKKGEIGGLFSIGEQPFGRVTSISFVEQITFEGWILGLK